MGKKMLNTLIDFELADGSKIQLSLAFYLLYQLRSKKKSVYDRYNKIMMKGPEEELDNIAILYTAYLCANLADIDECMDEVTFMQMMPYDRQQIANAIEALTTPKKK